MFKNEPKKDEYYKSKLKQEALECMQSLSTHGLRNLFSTKYNTLRVMWFFLTLGSSCLSVYFIGKILLEYLQFNVATEVRLVDLEMIEFPTISVCNKNKFSSKYSIGYVKNLVENNRKKIEEKSNYHDQDWIQIQNKLSLKETDAKYLYSIVPVEERQNYSMTFSESLLTCEFNKKKCNHFDFEWYFNSKYGNCYRFNSNGSKFNNKRVHQEYGLILDLYVGQPKELDIFGHESGAYVSIDSKETNTYSFFDNLIEISNGVETSIQLEKSLFTKYPKPYSNCDFYNLSINELNLDQIHYYNKVISANFSYSQSMCILFCRYDMFYNRNITTCKLTSNSLKVPNIKYCQVKQMNLTREDIVNIEQMENRYYDSLNEICLNQCPLECERIKYDTYIFTNKYPKMNLDLAKYMLNRSLIERDKEIQSNDFIRLKIFYGSLSQIEYKESPSMTLFGLISNLGGVLGLFLGIKLN